MKRQGCLVVHLDNDALCVADGDCSRKILEGNVMDIRKQHSSNIFEVEISGNPDAAKMLGPNFQVLETEEFTSHTTLRIKAEDHREPNELLSRLIGHAQVHAFREVLPTMNDIFIDTVKAAKA